MIAVDNATTERAIIVVAAFTFASSVIGAVLSYLGRNHARAANDAVNNQHEGAPKLVDRVVAMQDALVEHRAADAVRFTRLLDLNEQHANALGNLSERVDTVERNHAATFERLLALNRHETVLDELRADPPTTSRKG